jgi:uncharacterized protein YbjQ (UPF0145 family)
MTGPYGPRKGFAMTVPTSQQPQQLPQSAQDRLNSSRQGQPCFTSNLSVNEFVLTTQSGFEPLGLVMGTSIFHIGIQVSRWNVSQELPVLSQAMYHARELAMARMESEADALGADGVIGVQLRPLDYAFSPEVVEFVAVGTAVKATDGNSYRTVAGRPFTSMLSGQELWTLVQHGWIPRGLVLGLCVYHVAHLSFRQTLQAAGQNTELGVYTEAVYDAREIAMSRMQYEAQVLAADGVVGVNVQEASWIWGEHAIEYLALGTAVSRVRPDSSQVVPTFTMPLSG